ncbi:hypothetical protein [Nonomuraea sp. NPDC050786]
MASPCVFCRIVHGTEPSQTVYEDEHVPGGRRKSAAKPPAE